MGWVWIGAAVLGSQGIVVADLSQDRAGDCLWVVCAAVTGDDSQ
ncbi:hypothetical protein [Kistimonas scapharcae]